MSGKSPERYALFQFFLEKKNLVLDWHIIQPVVTFVRVVEQVQETTQRAPSLFPYCQISCINRKVTLALIYSTVIPARKLGSIC